MNTQKVDLGPVRSVYKGKYNPSTNYELLNMVEHNGSSYVVIKSPYVVGKVPGVDNDYWGLTAKKGDKGDKGENGRDGVDGGIYNPEDPTKPGGVKPKPNGGIDIGQDGNISVKPATPTVIGGVTFDNVTIKSKGANSTLYTPLLTAVAPTNNVNAVTSKAVADYAVSKNGNEVITGNKHFTKTVVHKISRSSTDTFRPNEYLTSFDAITSDNKYIAYIQNIIDSENKKVRAFIGCQDIFNQNTNVYTTMSLGFDNGVPVAFAQTPKAEHIGDYIATTKWVRDNVPVLSGAIPKKIGERTTSGDWTLSKLTVGKPLKIYSILGVGNNNVANISVKSGADTGKGTYALGNEYSPLWLYKSTNIFEIIPTSTTVILSVSASTSNKLVAYQ